MFKFCYIIFILFSLLAINADSVPKLPDEDTIIVTATFVTDAKSPASLNRVKRQFGDGLTYQYLSSATCFTRSGVLGRCLTVDQCYLYMKTSSPLSYYQSLMMGMQDTCLIMTPSGNQNAGVCCSDFRYIDSNQFPIFPPYYPHPIDPNDPAIAGSFDHQVPNWPPPLITHPPDHTAATHPIYQWPPPVPTHPTAPPATGPPITRPTPMWPNPTTSPSTSQKPAWTSPKPTTPRPQKPTSMKPVTRPEWPMQTRPITVTYPTSVADAEDLSFAAGECGVKNGKQDQERIVGGHDAEPGEWPWMAAILTSGRLFCGGSLIDDTHVLTAAHCVAHMNPWDVARLRVHLGDYNIKSKGDVQHIERKVKKVVRHRGFDPQTLYNDIALLTLDSPVPFSKNVRSICLPHNKAAYSGKMATVIGWGSLREMGPTPGILQEVNIPIWTNTDCRYKYGHAAPGGIVESFLCAGKASRDSCSGDSGGPLMVNEGKKWQQIGIVSWGIGCGKGQFPGVYTRITSFMPWISKNLKV